MNPNTDKIAKIVSNYYSCKKGGDSEMLSKIYIELVIARNSLAKSLGFENYTDMQVEKIHKIPSKDWLEYLNSRNHLANRFNPHIEKIKKYPHFLPQIPEMNISFPDQVYALFESIPIMQDISKRIDLRIEGNISNFKYDAQTDKYSIEIAESNHNQKIAMLIHELSHVAYQEIKDHKIESLYESEMGAHNTEFQIAESISPNFLQADIQEYLVCFVRAEFEQTIFTNPDHSPHSLFSSILNKYFGNEVDTECNLFLFDDKIIMKPLSDLSTVVAISNLLLSK